MKNKLLVSLVAMLLLFSGVGYAATQTFKDVKKSHWFYPYVQKASELGIIDGYADGTFRPSDPVTRAQFSKMIVEYHEKTQAQIVEAIQDSSTEEQSIINTISKVVPNVVKIQTDSTQASGFFVKPNYIISNNHVTAGFEKVDVFLANGEQIEGSVVHADKYKDISLIKVEGTYKYLQLADTVTAGQVAMAVGHPLGFDYSVSKGIVSKLNITDYKASNMFQMDTAINSGNSGGAVVNSKGQVIGMTTGKIVYQIDETPVEGLAYAVHVAELKKFITTYAK